MRKSKFADFNQSIMGDNAAEEYDRAIRRDIHAIREREQLRGKDARGRTLPPWKVRDADEPEPPVKPSWEWKLNEHNLVCELRQLETVRGTMDESPKYRGRRFKLSLFEGCGGPAGLSLAVGCKIDCFADLAFSLHNVRGTITEEYAAK